MVHGNKPEEVLRDLEGTQTMRTLGLNMAWVLTRRILSNKILFTVTAFVVRNRRKVATISFGGGSKA